MVAAGPVDRSEERRRSSGNSGILRISHTGIVVASATRQMVQVQEERPGSPKCVQDRKKEEGG